MQKDRELAIVIYGATGFTGQLVAEYLQARYANHPEVRWALAGRSEEKLIQLKDKLGVSAEVPVVVADADDSASLREMVARAAVVLTTVGPYQLYGSELLALCAELGTDYVDLCGEPAWMAEMIGAHHATAQASGARIVFSCGFDSIPFDLGVFRLQREAQEKLGRPLSRIKGRVRGLRGSMSGGTVASFKATMAAAAKQPGVIDTLRNPFSLADGFAGPEQPAADKPAYDEAMGSWAAPFMMAVINTKIVHRSNHLLGHAYGKDFVYDEMLLTGHGEKGEQMAQHVAADQSMASNPVQPGEGPSREEREAGFYDLLFIGEAGEGAPLAVSVKGQEDPGYGSTSKMIAESAVCLWLHPDLASGGIWTTAPVMGDHLIKRLAENAGIEFSVEVMG